MPLPFAPFLGWIVGVVLAWVSAAALSPGGGTGARAPRDAGERGVVGRLAETAAASWGGRGIGGTRLSVSRPFLVALALTVLVYTPILAYFAAFHGDWAYLYLVPWNRVPSAVDLALVLVGGGALPVGFAVAAPLVRRRRVGPLTMLALGPGAAGVALALLASKRLVLNATYAQFQGDFGAEAISSSALGRGVLVMGIVLALAIAWSVRALAILANPPGGRAGAAPLGRSAGPRGGLGKR